MRAARIETYAIQLFNLDLVHHFLELLLDRACKLLFSRVTSLLGPTLLAISLSWIKRRDLFNPRRLFVDLEIAWGSYSQDSMPLPAVLRPLIPELFLMNVKEIVRFFLYWILKIWQRVIMLWIGAQLLATYRNWAVLFLLTINRGSYRFDSRDFVRRGEVIMSMLSKILKSRLTTWGILLV